MNTPPPSFATCRLGLIVLTLLLQAPAALAARSEVDARGDAGRSEALVGDFEAVEATSRAAGEQDAGDAAARDSVAPTEPEWSPQHDGQRERTRAQLLEAVEESWRRPAVVASPAREGDAPGISPLAAKLDAIVLPSVSFSRTEIGQVIAALGAAAEEFDQTETGSKGVNIVLLDPSNQSPKVSLTLHNASLRRVLDFVTASVGYQYEMQPDAVVIRPGGETSVLETDFFPVARATVLRMAGLTGAAANSSPRSEAIASAAVESDAPAGNSANAHQGMAIRGFLQQAGVNFDAVPGASLAYDGSALIVTQTARNLERIRNILRRYDDVRQVEIEAKFMEVQEGALEELGVNWSLSQKATQHGGTRAAYQSQSRSLSAAFGSAVASQAGRIVRPEIPATTGTVFDSAGNPRSETISAGEAAIDIPIVNNAPQLPGSANLATGAGALASISGVIGEFDVNAVVRALSQKQGTDLLSAPKVTVLSGNPATITVAQEMRYPQSFGQTQSQVGTGSASGGGSAGVAITAGTPQEFAARNVGVELKVTPTVEEDDHSISLDLNPKVTEFDGFVEYGGPSIAISGGTTVTVPSGFYQPIFSVRDISTRVTIWDGATLVMGGLTREEVKKVNDKVPILGDIPFIGRAFRSKGETAQKRNLLIFVTASLVNPGGAPKRERVRRLSGNTPYRNPGDVDAPAVGTGTASAAP